MDAPYILGIDPGVSGALALLRGTDLVVFDVPNYQHINTDKSRRTVVDIARLADIAALLADFRPIVVREAVRGMHGDNPLAIGNLLYSAGCIDGVLSAHGCVIATVEPRDWKSALGLPGRKHPGAKDVSLQMARAAFPDCKQLVRQRDHNRAEAALIAWYYQMLCSKKPVQVTF